MVDGVGTTKYSYTAAGQLLTEDGPFASDTVTNIYSNRLRVEMDLEQPTGLWTNSFAWDPVKRLTNVTSTAGSFGYQYEAGFPTHLIAKLSLPNTAYISNAFDANARLLGTYLKNNSGSVLDSYVYAYNPANQRTNLTRADTTGAAYTYDRIGQLTIADDSGGTYSRGYAYDASWNLIRRTNFCGAPPNCVQSFTNDSRNQLTDFAGETAQYDANGNLTNRDSGDLILFTYTYDDENRLTFMEYDDWGSPYYQLNQLAYDGLGRLRSATEYIYDGENWVPTDVKTYIYDGWRVIDGRDENSTRTGSYTRGSDLSGTLEGAGGIGGLLARSCGYSSGNWSTNSHYFADGNGNIVYMLDGSQSMVAKYLYDPFGHLISASGSLASDNSYWFSSKEILGKNLAAYGALYYYGYRFYEPYLQRWLNRDPLGELGFSAVAVIAAPRAASDANAYHARSSLTAVGENANDEEVDSNAYRAFRNSAINLIDPLGEVCLNSCICSVLPRRPVHFGGCTVGCACKGLDGTTFTFVWDLNAFQCATWWALLPPRAFP